MCGHGGGRALDQTDTKSTSLWWDKIQESVWLQVQLTLYCQLAQTRLHAGLFLNQAYHFRLPIGSSRVERDFTYCASVSVWLKVGLQQIAGD